MPSLRARVVRLASQFPQGSKERRILLNILTDGKVAAYPREGSATITGLNGNGFYLYYRITRSPLGLTAEEMPRLGAEAHKSMAKFVERLSDGLGIPLALSDKSSHVLLDVDNGSIVFKVEGSVKNRGSATLTREMIEDMEQPVFSRFGYRVIFG